MLEDRDYMRRPAYREPLVSLTVLLIILNAVFYGMEWIALNDPRGSGFIGDFLALSLDGLRHGFLWQFVTYQFLHAGIWHLLFNCLAIFFFGRPVETALGRSRFLALYLAGGVIGGVVQMVFALVLPHYFGGSVVGASAGAAALAAAFAVLNWQDRFTLLIYFFPVNMRGRTMFWLLVGLAVLGILTPHSSIANAAHLGGILTGFFYIRRMLQGSSMHSEPPVRSRPPRELAARLKENKFWRARPPSPPEDLSAEEFLKRKVDPILDKISAHGIQSLTAGERETLERARTKMAKH